MIAQPRQEHLLIRLVIAPEHVAQRSAADKVTDLFRQVLLGGGDNLRPEFNRHSAPQRHKLPLLYDSEKLNLRLQR